VIPIINRAMTDESFIKTILQKGKEAKEKVRAEFSDQAFILPKPLFI
jgi:hypothetical protein